MTTNFGRPVENDLDSMTAGNPGPVLIQDVHLVEKLAHFNRERIPERVVHAKGTGAGGYFELTKDVSEWTKAKFLSEVGKRTEVFVRFSTVGGEKGSADAERDPRGFAVKFYTEDGNYDLVGNNTPVFFIRDPLKFPDFIHTQKRKPGTNLKDPDMFWDFLSLTPESVHQVTILFSDRGTPRSYRNMNGYGSHTFKWYNYRGEMFYVKYHFKTDQGVENLTMEEAEEVKGKDPDHATRDLHEAIERGDPPSWTLQVQIMTPEEAEEYRFDPFDVTKVWPHGDYPPMDIGRMVLDRNPANYFAEVEQAAFSPGNFVPGIAASEDKMLQGRLFAYPDAHRYRLGANYHQIPVNASKAKVDNYQRDGAMRTDGNMGDGPNYWPNSHYAADPVPGEGEPMYQVAGMAGRQPYKHGNDDFVQAGALYNKAMNDQDRANLVKNIVAHLGNARRDIQQRQVKSFFKADADYGRRVAVGLGLSEDDLV